MENENQLKSFNLILHSGNAQSCAMEAIYSAKEDDFKTAKEKLEQAQEEMVLAHKVQTELLFGEANNEKYEINVLLIHAMDHMATSNVVVELAEELVGLHQKLSCR